MAIPEMVMVIPCDVIDNRVGDWQQSRDPFRTHGPSEVVVKVSQGVDHRNIYTALRR